MREGGLTPAAQNVPPPRVLLRPTDAEVVRDDVDDQPEAVDVRSILDMTKTIAHDFERPMAPVGAYVLGLAVGRLQEQGRPVDLESLRSHLESTLPPASRTEQA